MSVVLPADSLLQIHYNQMSRMFSHLSAYMIIQKDTGLVTVLHLSIDTELNCRKDLEMWSLQKGRTSV